MALDYAGSAALMKTATFVDRVKVACIKFANSILIESPTTSGHTARERWAQQARANPDGTAQAVAVPTVMDPQVQLDGATITDANLQAAVEVAVEKFF